MMIVKGSIMVEVTGDKAPSNNIGWGPPHRTWIGFHIDSFLLDFFWVSKEMGGKEVGIRDRKED